FLANPPLPSREGRPFLDCRVRRRRRPLAKPRRIWFRKSLPGQSDLPRRAPLPPPSWTNRGYLLEQTHYSRKLTLAGLARCFNTLLSVAARELPSCWPRLTTRPSSTPAAP